MLIRKLFHFLDRLRTNFYFAYLIISSSIFYKNQLIINLEQARMFGLSRLLILLLILYKKPLKKYFIENPNSELFNFFIRNQIGDTFFGTLLQNCDVHNKSVAGAWRILKNKKNNTTYFLNNLISDKI
jgi:hypothetical protein